MEKKLRTAAQVVVLAIASACGAHFIEPNPPELVRLQHFWKAPVVDEPVALLLVFDLHFRSSDECVAAQQRLEKSARETLLGEGRAGEQLPSIEISPGCLQRPVRRLDVRAAELAFIDAESRLSAHLRPVILYFNNIDLPLPDELAADLEALRQRSVARGALQPTLWSVVTPVVAAQFGFDRPLPWTHSADPGLRDQLMAQARQDLPFRTQVWSSHGARPLLPGEELVGLQKLKVCLPDSRILPTGFTTDGLAAAIDRRTPPGYLVQLPDVLAAPREGFVEEEISLELEACRDHCDRFLSDGNQALVAWDAVPGCLLPEAVGIR